MAEAKSTRGIFCNRTLNMRSIQAIGYDMDYTLIHYNVEEWERRAYEYLKQHFEQKGWPVGDLQFDPEMVCRGLIVDTENGNLVKANRFGFIKQATHGTREIGYEQMREAYSRVIVDLAEPRWVFLNTLFSLSEGCMYSQLVDLLDSQRIPATLGYYDLYVKVRDAMSFAHMEGRLKAEIIADPDKYVELDEETPLALLDQKHAGKKLMLITNSEWHYTVPMMEYAFDRFLPGGMNWRDLFDVVIVSAGKPGFFAGENSFFEIATDEGLLAPVRGGLKTGAVYYGGSARALEKHLDLTCDEFLYVGDHMFGDVRVTKNVLRWRTALVLREIESEIAAVGDFKKDEETLAALMDEKEALEARNFQAKLALQRVRGGYGPRPSSTEEELREELNSLRSQLDSLDERISPLARAATRLNNPVWGPLMRSGNDKSHLAYQIERFADIYTSRVSNFVAATPFFYLRSPRGSLPHDPSLPGGRPHSPLSPG